MRRIARLTVLAAALPMLAAAQQDLPPPWYPIGDQGMDKYRIEVGPDWGYQGSGVRVYSVDDRPGSFGGIGQAISAAHYRGKKIRLTGYLRTRDVEGFAGLWLRVDDSQGESLLDNMSDRGADGTSEWRRYSAVLPVSGDAVRVLFGAIPKTWTSDGRRPPCRMKMKRSW